MSKLFSWHTCRYHALFAIFMYIKVKTNDWDKELNIDIDWWT